MDARAQAAEFGYTFGDPYILGTQERDSRLYNPAMLGKDFAVFCKMNGFDCSFHDLRHTFATMMVGNGCDVRTVASYLGHVSVSMTLDIYADADPEAKRAAVSKVEDNFDMDMTGCGMDLFLETHDALGRELKDVGAAAPALPGLNFTLEQLRAMLAAAEAKEAGNV